MPASVGPAPPPVPGTREFTLAPVGPGWSVYLEQLSPLSDLERGGICVGVVHSERADLETGEVYPVTTYHCLAYWNPALPNVYIEASRVDVERTAFDRLGAWSACKFCLKQVLARKSRAPTPADYEWMTYAWRLFRAITE